MCFFKKTQEVHIIQPVEHYDLTLLSYTTIQQSLDYV